jgi:hypothetical protein
VFVDRPTDEVVVHRVTGLEDPADDGALGPVVGVLGRDRFDVIDLDNLPDDAVDGERGVALMLGAAAEQPQAAVVLVIVLGRAGVVPADPGAAHVVAVGVVAPDRVELEVDRHVALHIVCSLDLSL